MRTRHEESLTETMSRAYMRMYEEEQSEAEAERRFAELVSEAITEATDASLPGFLETAKRMGRRTLRDERKIRRRFERNLRRRWGTALESLLLVISGCTEVGSDWNKRERKGWTEPEEIRYSVLVALHAKACRVAREIHALLEVGYATGALARWRTLHELNVFAHVIASSDPEIARRYAEHEQMQNLKDARSYDAYHSQLGYEPLDAGALDAIEAEAAELESRNGGASFRTDYGWAMPLLRVSGDTSFHGMEKLAGFAHMDPFYKWACNDVHGGSKGTRANTIRRGPHRIMLAGAHNAGLADPGQMTALSLVQITLPLLTLGPLRDDGDLNLDMMLYMKGLLALANETADKFMTAHGKLEADEARVWEGASATIDVARQSSLGKSSG